MAIDYKKLKSWPFKEIVQPYTAKDCILYALGLGLGADPLDRNQLRFVYEDNLQMLPTMPVVLGSPGFWLRDAGTGVEWKTVLHGEQGLTIHRPLPAVRNGGRHDQDRGDHRQGAGQRRTHLFAPRSS